MKPKIYPAILVEGAFAPMGYFYKNRNVRCTVPEWMEVLESLQKIYDGTPGSKDRISSFEYKEFPMEEQYRNFLDATFRADSCWSDHFSRYKVITCRQIILPEQDVRGFLIDNGLRVPDAERNIHILKPCFIDYVLDGGGKAGVVCGLHIDESTSETFITVKSCHDNAVSDIRPEDLADSDKAFLDIWKCLPIHPFVVEKNTPSQKHVRTCFDSIADAYREMCFEYHDEMRDDLHAKQAVDAEHLFYLGSGHAIVRWNKNLEYTWKITNLLDPSRVY